MIDLLINELKKDKTEILKFIADNTKLKQGIYLKVNVDVPFDKTSFKNYFIIDKKDLDKSNYKCELVGVDRNNLIDYVTTRDILSGLLNDDANKTIDGNSKKVLSSTYQTLCVSNKFTTFPNDKFDTVNDFIEIINSRGFEALENIGAKIVDTLQLNKLNVNMEDLHSLIAFSKSDFRVNQIKLIKKYIVENFGEIISFVESQKLSAASKTKIFFYSESELIEDNLDAYNREYNYYLNSYIFNKGTTVVLDNEIKGSIPYGFNNSDAKPLIKPRRVNFDYVKYHSISEALDTKLAYDFLKIVSDNRSAKMIGIDRVCDEQLFDCNLDDLVKLYKANKQIYFKLHFKDKYIEDYDLVSDRVSDKVINSAKKIKCIDYLNETKEFSKRGNFEKTERSEFYIKELLSFLVFSKTESLTKYDDYSSYGLVSSDKGSVMLENKCGVVFEKYKYLIHDFLTSYTCKENLVDTIMNKFTKECIDAYFNTMFASKYFYFNLSELLNVKLNLLNKFREGNSLTIMLQNMKEKLLNLKDGELEQITINNDSEFYFLLGQVAYYLESQSKGDIDFGILKFYTEKRTYSNIKKYLLQRLEVFGYKISLNNKTFKALLEVVLNYEAKEDMNKNSESFYLGVCSDNIFYRTKKND